MKINKLTLNSPDYPPRLRHIPAKPKVLFHIGAPLNDLLKRKAVAIVGTRRISIYGEQVTRRFAKELAEQGVVIVSGLALGVDGMAHRAALEAGGLCIAVLPCPLDKIVPANNRRLAQSILDQGGALVSEYPPGEHPVKQYFIARNRIMSGLADAVLITEAGAKSGARHTADFAIKQGRDIMAVPGNITNIGSVTVNNLIKTSNASAVTEPKDVLHVLGLESHTTNAKQVKGSNANEQRLLDLMLEGITDGEQLLEHSGLKIELFNQALTMLEIGGKVRPLGLNNWAIF
ncbi:MAG TPA: DNA-processing protein DprA [Candidatus Saccharimonadales bacterium]|jgi:DNA processing protein|nr:DNA-processing protein DprA [Candidatus Saccharimonadales bacterium]